MTLGDIFSLATDAALVASVAMLMIGVSRQHRRITSLERIVSRLLAVGAADLGVTRQYDRDSMNELREELARLEQRVEGIPKSGPYR